MGNTPALQIPNPVILKGQLHPPLIPDPFGGNRRCRNALGTETGTFPQRAQISGIAGILPQLKCCFGSVQVDLPQAEPHPPYVAADTPGPRTSTGLNILPEVKTAIGTFQTRT